MELVHIPITKVDEVWSLVKDNIQEALTYSGNQTDIDFVYKTIKANNFQLWIVWDESKKTIQEQYNGVVITEIIQRQLKRSCHIYIMTGKNRQQWQHLIKVIEDFAAQHECDNMELICRPGWQRILQNYNYVRTHIVTDKAIIKKEKT